METDNQLLARYAHDGSEAAFRELVERRINLAHAAALRESKGDVSQAEDITQAVFTELAHRASSLVRHPALAGWLYTCVRRLSANVRRAKDRRQRREQDSFAMNELLSPDPSDKLWQQVRPVLDDAMHELNEEDRTAVVLRFFEGRSLKDVGLALGLNENAARMRVERSLEKLRHFLSTRGVKSTAATLAAVLALGSVSSASAALAAPLATGALAAAASKNSAAFLSMAKVKMASVIATLGVAAALVVWHQVRLNGAKVSQTGQAQPAVAAQQPSAAPSPAQDNAAAANPASTNAIASSQMRFRVVEEETGAPLPNTKIRLAYFRDDSSAKVVKRVTDTNGELGVDALQTPFCVLNLFATSDGHAPKCVTWNHQDLPEEYTLKLPQATTLAGVVVDDANEPVASAVIKFSIPGGIDMTQHENIDFGPDTDTRTDTKGHWSCNMIPTDLDHVSLVITHTNHAETEATIRIEAPDANSSVITMAAGFTVTGAVIDLNGLAIPKAKVRQVRMNSDREALQTTDALGNFVFKNVKAGELILAAQAQGFAPAVQTLQVAGMVTAPVFRLGPGNLLRGHVVDENGHPISHARARTKEDSMVIRKVEWSTQTGANGRFAWDSAPQEPLLYTFSAEGFMPADELSLPADGSDHEIKLTSMQPGNDMIQITGTAVDAETGQPLDTFTVRHRRIEPDWVVPFEFGTSGKDGKFTLSQPGPAFRTNYQLQVEKEGYLPSLSANLLAKDGNQTLAFRLQKGSGPCGIVLLPDGGPAANATVYLCTSQSGVTLDGPAHVKKGMNTTTCLAHTDETGKFQLPAAAAPEGVIVIHDQGFAQLSFTAAAAASNITLQAWGRIEGALILDSQTATNEGIYASYQVAHYDEQGRRFGFMTYGFGTTTDSLGKFSFEKMPPGQCFISRQNRDHRTQVVINPGETTQVALGGTGRPIIGNAVLTGVTDSIDWSNASVYLTSKSESELGPYPTRDAFPSAAAFIQAMQSWRVVYDAQRFFGTVCDRKGSFRLQDVPSGTYELKITVRGSMPDSVSPNLSRGPGPEIATLVREVIVPEIPTGLGNEPLDLGTLALALKQNDPPAP